MKHSSDPIECLGGWMPHCICGWLDADTHLFESRHGAHYLAHEHIARTPEAWENQ